MAGVKVLADIPGTSFLPLLKEDPKKVSWRKEAYYHYYEFPQPHHVYPHFGIRTEQYMLVRFYGESNSWELYDLQKDPHEVNNLYGQKPYEKLTTTLKDKLKKLMIQYKDTDALKILETK